MRYELQKKSRGGGSYIIQLYVNAGLQSYFTNIKCPKIDPFISTGELITFLTLLTSQNRPLYFHWRVNLNYIL
jgi:hypothetical protein